MIKFFRKIRQHLLSEGKTGKYFKYAIGEIVLVVIGILIALQINNWNVQNKQREIEIKVLKEMQVAIKSDLKSFDKNIKDYKKVRRSLKIIKEQLEIEMPTNDSLAYAFTNSLYNNRMEPNLGAYETLKNKGIDLISNDSIRLKIIDVYEVSYKYYQDLIKTDLLPESFIQEYCATLFNNLDYYSSKEYDEPTMVPNNYKALQKDTLYKTIINTRISQVRRTLNYLEYNYQEVKELNEIIKTELKSFK